MAEIHLVRAHTLGLAGARRVAEQWAEHAEAELGMDCTIEEGDDRDTVRFTRSGVKGELEVSAGAFELQAHLGLLVGAFKHTIEAEIEKNLDALLAPPPKRKAARTRSA